MNKFDKTIEELKTKFFNIKDVLAVFLYGSVARGDYSVRHSDLDIFIILNKKKITEKVQDKINHLLWSLGSKNGVKIHTEYQGLKIRVQDKTLFEKIIEEGKLIYSKVFIITPAEKLGLKQFAIYSYKAKDQKTKTRLSQILHGNRSWYYKGKKKIIKEYNGLIDNETIIAVGKGAVMVRQEKRKDIENSFERLNIEYHIKKIVYA